MSRVDVSLPVGSLAIADLILDCDNYRAVRGDTAIDLTPVETAVLAALARNAGHIVRYAEIAHKVWGYDGETCADILKVHVCRIRRKLGLKSGTIVLRTRHHLGYLLEVRSS